MIPRGVLVLTQSQRARPPPPPFLVTSSRGAVLGTTRQVPHGCMTRDCWIYVCFSLSTRRVFPAERIFGVSDAAAWKVHKQHRPGIQRLVDHWLILFASSLAHFRHTNRPGCRGPPEFTQLQPQLPCHTPGGQAPAEPSARFSSWFPNPKGPHREWQTPGQDDVAVAPLVFRP